MALPAASGGAGKKIPGRQGQGLSNKTTRGLSALPFYDKCAIHWLDAKKVDIPDGAAYHYS
jgi:hypothetical protein